MDDARRAAARRAFRVGAAAAQRALRGCCSRPAGVRHGRRCTAGVTRLLLPPGGRSAWSPLRHSGRSARSPLRPGTRREARCAQPPTRVVRAGCRSARNGAKTASRRATCERHPHAEPPTVGEFAPGRDAGSVPDAARARVLVALRTTPALRHGTCPGAASHTPSAGVVPTERPRAPCPEQQCAPTGRAQRRGDSRRAGRAASRTGVSPQRPAVARGRAHDSCDLAPRRPRTGIRRPIRRSRAGAGVGQARRNAAFNDSGARACSTASMLAPMTAAFSAATDCTIERYSVASGVERV